MSGLKIKHYVKSATIRSVGDEPNGILGICNHPDTGSVFVIDPKTQPASPLAPNVTFQHVGAHPDDVGGTVVTAEDVVEASVHCPRTVAMVWQAAVANCELQARQVLVSFDVEKFEAAVHLLHEVRDQLAVAGVIDKGGD